MKGACPKTAVLCSAAIAAAIWLCACTYPQYIEEPPISVITPPPSAAAITPSMDSSPATTARPTAEPTATPRPVYYKSRVNTLNCRTSPSSADDSNLVGQIGFEDKGIYLGEEGDFTLLRMEDGSEVYCYSAYLVPEDIELYAYVKASTGYKTNLATGAMEYESDGITPIVVKNELVDLRLYLPEAHYELLFATPRNITGAPLYPRAVPLMQRDTVKKLVKAYDIFKADGYTLKVYDAYRPRSVQRILYNIVQNKHWIANPDTTASNHNRGCAIDLSLIIDATGEEIEVPTPMHTFTVESARTCETWSEAARANVDYITGVMEKCGFNYIESEWWHYSDTDSKKFMTTDIDLGSLTMLPEQEENQ